MLVIICIFCSNINLKDKQEKVFGTSMAIWDEIKLFNNLRIIKEKIIYGHSFPLFTEMLKKEAQKKRASLNKKVSSTLDLNYN